MRILVCYKYVRDENEISVNPDRTLNTDAASWVISPYDVNAVEAAMKLAEAAGESTVEVLTVGGEAVENSKMKKAILSRGPAKMYAVKCDACGDMYATASLLAQAVEKLGSVDLIICGDGSGDMYSQTMGNLLAGILGIPAVNNVNALSYENGSIIAARSCGSDTELLEVSGCAVVSVTSDICRARIPSMKDILSAGKKPVEQWSAADMQQCPPQTELLSMLAPEKAQRSSIVYKGEDALERFAAELAKHI